MLTSTTLKAKLTRNDVRWESRSLSMPPQHSFGDRHVSESELQAVRVVDVNINSQRASVSVLVWNLHGIFRTRTRRNAQAASSREIELAVAIQVKAIALPIDDVDLT